MPNRVEESQIAFGLRQEGRTYNQIATQLNVPVSTARRLVARGELFNSVRVTNQEIANLDSTGRRFGIEIEFNGVSMARAFRALQDAGVNVTRPGYTHRVIESWKLITDGSVSGSGLELVSPILSGESGYSQVMMVMSVLGGIGGRVNTSCGMHVHHDAGDLNGDVIASFVEAYVLRQGAIDQLVAPSRRNQHRGYCRRVTESELDLIGRSFRNDRTAPSMPGDGRYRTINVQSFPRYGTIEIRQHQGSLNGKKAVAWIKFGQSLINSAIEGQSVLLPNEVLPMLASLTTNHGLDNDAAEYLVTRALHFSSAE